MSFRMSLVVVVVVESKKKKVWGFLFAFFLLLFLLLLLVETQRLRRPVIPFLLWTEEKEKEKSWQDRWTTGSNRLFSCRYSSTGLDEIGRKEKAEEAESKSQRKSPFFFLSCMKNAMSNGNEAQSSTVDRLGDRWPIFAIQQKPRVWSLLYLTYMLLLTEGRPFIPFLPFHETTIPIPILLDAVTQQHEKKNKNKRFKLKEKRAQSACQSSLSLSLSRSSSSGKDKKKTESTAAVLK